MKISISGLNKSFGETQVLKNINLDIPSGSFSTILGVSGCGKTTLLRIIAGLEKADEGEIYFDDQCVYSSHKSILLAAEKRNLGFVFQDFALWPHMSVFENVAFGLRCKKQTSNLVETVGDALKAVRLTGFENRYPHQLSGGQQQRVAFARAIAVNPGCILFDEPLSALDAVLREEMRNELRELVTQKGLTAIFVTHDQTEAMTMSDSVVVMEKGSIIQIGTPEEIYCTPRNHFVGTFIGRSNWLTESTMIRPEHISALPIENSTKISVEVVKNSFLGGSYLLTVKKDDYLWTLYSQSKIKEGKIMDVFVHPQNIIECQKENVR